MRCMGTVGHRPFFRFGGIVETRKNNAKGRDVAAILLMHHPQHSRTGSLGHFHGNNT